MAKTCRSCGESVRVSGIYRLEPVCWRNGYCQECYDELFHGVLPPPHSITGAYSASSASPGIRDVQSGGGWDNAVRAVEDHG